MKTYIHSTLLFSLCKKRLLPLLLLFSIFVINTEAQTNFNYAEYFFDTDPGIGNGSAIGVSLTPDSVTITLPAISTAGLGTGMHTLFVRSRTDGIQWSLYEGRPFFIKPSITFAEYFIDTDPGVGNGIAIPVTADEDSITVAAAITTGVLSGGTHRLYIRTRDNTGNYSLHEGRPFFVTSSTALAAAEWFIDTDPGIGNGTALSINGNDSASFTGNIVTPNNLTGGTHYLYVRAKTQAGLWGLYEPKPFFVTSQTTIAAAEWFIDTDPGIGNGTSLSINGLDSASFAGYIVTPNNLTGGTHFLYVRAKTLTGKWSLYEPKPFFVNLATTINAAEYFIDTDPGIGNGTPITVTAGLDSISGAAAITIPNNLKAGNHYLYLRTRSLPGKWSLHEGRKFVVKPSIVAAEYFVDNDPGIGNANPITLIAGFDSVTVNTTFATACISSGVHYVFVRTKDSNGIWSLYEPDTITVTGTNPVIFTAGNDTICSGDSVMLNLNASTACSLQWLLNGTPIAGATGTTYMVHTSGSYQLKQTTGGIDYVSNAKNITVLPFCNQSVWTGNSSTSWFTPGNWSNNLVPNSCSLDVVIPSTPSGGVFPVISTGSPQVHDMVVQNGASINIATNQTLSVCGNLTGGVATDAVVTGSGELRMVGSATQTISGKINLNTLRILTSTTAVTVNITGNVSLNKALVMDKGKVANSGTVTLKSNALTTAYLDNFTSATPGTYTGNLTVERYLTNKNDGYRNISSPVTTKVSDLNDDFPVIGQNGVNCWYSYNPYPNVQYYNESLNNPNNTYPVGFVSYTGLTNTLTAMKGLAARIYPNNTNLTLDFTGKPYTGNKSFPITFTNTGSIAADGWNLVGNCYPSPILWGKVKQANPGEIDAAYYVFQTTGEFTGNWGSYNGTTSVNGATNEIGIGQGFWVLASGNTTLDMNQGVRTAKETTQFFKTDELQTDEVRLSIGNGTQMDEIVTYTDPNGTKGYDRDYDAVKMPGSTVSMSFTNESNEYAINVIDAITAQTELPLNITTEEEGVYSISATELNTELPVYLKDQVSNTLSDLKAGSVSIYLNKGEVYNNRYSVVFDAPQISGINTTESNPIRIYSYNNRIVVERPTNSTATINVSNVLGQQITNINTTTERTELPMTANEPWYAFVKVTEGNKVSVAKVLIKNK